jgi:hypothetical protein
MQAMSTEPRAEMDIDDARRRLSQAAQEAKALEDAGGGYASNAAWERYQLIADAIEAQERRARLAQRPAGASS